MSSLKELLIKVYKLKYYILVFFVAFIVFFMVYFPSQRAASFVIDSVATQTGLVISSTGEDMSFFPAIGISVETANVKTAPMNPELKLGKSFFGIPILSLIVFSPSLKIETNSFGGDIDAKIYGIPLTPKKKIDELLIDLNAKDIRLGEILKQVFPMVDLDAKTTLNVDGSVNAVNIAYSELNINADLENIHLKGVPPLIPDIKVKSGKLKVAMTNGEITIEKLVLGGPNQPIDVTIKGKISLKANMPYDVTMNIKLGGDAEKDLGNFLSIIPAQAKKPDGTYSFRLKGTSKSPIPQVIPL